MRMILLLRKSHTNNGFCYPSNGSVLNVGIEIDDMLAFIRCQFYRIDMTSLRNIIAHVCFRLVLYLRLG